MARAAAAEARAALLRLHLLRLQSLLRAGLPLPALQAAAEPLAAGSAAPAAPVLARMPAAWLAYARLLHTLRTVQIALAPAAAGGAEPAQAAPACPPTHRRVR